MPLPSTTYPNIASLINDINTRFVPNGMELITGDIGNSQLNGLANFIVEYTLNSGLAGISSSTGVVPLSKPVTVFTVTPTSVSWPDNIQNEYYIVNATANDISLASGYSYIDQYQAAQTTIPARTSIHIAKATNGNWILVNNIGGGAGASLPPQPGHEGEFLTTNGTSASWFSPCLFITSDDFESDGVTYLNSSISDNQYLLFWNDLPRFIYNQDQNASQIEWEYVVGGGFKILFPGFDANLNNYFLCLFLKGLNS
jgi:hypothetical protein